VQVGQSFVGCRPGAGVPSHQCQCQCQSKFVIVAKIAELLRSPRRHSRVTIQNQEMIVEKEMFLDVNRKQVGMEMSECQLEVSSIWSDAATGKERRPTVVRRIP